MMEVCCQRTPPQPPTSRRTVEQLGRGPSRLQRPRRLQRPSGLLSKASRRQPADVSATATTATVIRRHRHCTASVTHRHRHRHRHRGFATATVTREVVFGWQAGSGGIALSFPASPGAATLAKAMELPAVGSHLLVVEYHTSDTAWVQVHGRSGGDDGLFLVGFVAAGRQASQLQAVQQAQPQQPQLLQQQAQPQQPQLQHVQQAQQPHLGDEHWGNLWIWRRPLPQTEDRTQQQQQPRINRPRVDAWLYFLQLMRQQREQQQPQQQQQGHGEPVLTPTGDEAEGDEYNPWWDLEERDPVDNSANPEILEAHSASG